MTGAVLALTDRGLYCPAGDFYIDPWRDVERAVITHAHGDHARIGSRKYLVAAEGVSVLRTRFGPSSDIRAFAYGDKWRLGDAIVSLHPAGHILGSAQVRIEVQGEVWVVSGDYKLDSDPTCRQFVPVRCHGFVTESTFGLPIYRWPKPETVFAEINAWWKANRDAGKTSVLFCYSLGKAQRLLAGLDPAIGPILEHGASARLTQNYRDSGIALPPTSHAGVGSVKRPFAGSLVLAPPSAGGTPWIRKFQPLSAAFASGWMRIRGARRRRAIDRGFVLSDHADWPNLLRAIEATGAEKVWVTHGYSAILARFLREKGIDASTVATRFEGEFDEPMETDAAVTASSPEVAQDRDIPPTPSE